MKAIVISDIHGIKTNLTKIKNRYKELNCDKLIVLGDLYWGNCQANYDPEYVRNFLRTFGEDLICIRGNCDFRVNHKEEPFSISQDNLINIADNIYITHGHLYNETNWIIQNSILIFGHYHVPFIKENASITYINPGSISTPRSKNLPSYLLIDDHEFTIYDINDTMLAHISK